MDPWEEHLARQRGHELEDLRHHWGEAYAIGWDEEFVAERLDGRGVIFAPTAHELYEAMRWDYCQRPVPRDPLDGERGLCAYQHRGPCHHPGEGTDDR